MPGCRHARSDWSRRRSIAHPESIRNGRAPAQLPARASQSKIGPKTRPLSHTFMSAGHSAGSLSAACVVRDANAVVAAVRKLQIISGEHTVIIGFAHDAAVHVAQSDLSTTKESAAGLARRLTTAGRRTGGAARATGLAIADVLGRAASTLDARGAGGATLREVIAGKLRRATRILEPDLLIDEGRNAGLIGRATNGFRSLAARIRTTRSVQASHIPVTTRLTTHETVVWTDIALPTPGPVVRPAKIGAAIARFAAYLSRGSTQCRLRVSATRHGNYACYAARKNFQRSSAGYPPRKCLC